MGQNHYLITSLPALGELGSDPPMTGAEFLGHLADSPGAANLVETLLLADDLLQRDAVLAGEMDQPSPAVLTAAQLADEEPLPGYLVDDERVQPRRVAGDAVWAAYFRRAAEVADSRRCRFLSGWVRFEVALRNALAEQRAKALELDAHEYFVVPQLSADIDLSGTIGAWAGAADPLAGMKVLDQARWQWLNENDAWYSFRDDELAAYAARLMLLARWQRLARAAGETPVAPTRDRRIEP